MVFEKRNYCAAVIDAVKTIFAFQILLTPVHPVLRAASPTEPQEGVRRLVFCLLSAECGLSPSSSRWRALTLASAASSTASGGFFLVGSSYFEKSKTIIQNK